MMNTTKTLIALLCLAFVTACGGDTPTPVASANETERVEVDNTDADEGSYGSDPVLDRLQDDCSDGDTDACDDLFWDSPLDSEYEAFGRERMSNDSGEFDFRESDELTTLVFEMAWDSLSASERDEVCTGLELSPEMMYGAFTEGFGSDAPSFAAFEEFFGSAC